MKRDKGYFDFQQPMSKSQPALPGQNAPKRGIEPGEGDAHEFNTKGKVTEPGGDYADMNPESGLHGNFDQKDASMAYLKERGMKGQEIKHYNATHIHAKVHTGNAGGTAYPNNPVYEAYRPATSNEPACAYPVIRPKEARPENPESKNMKDVTEKLK